jgi:hypothetical protein
VNRRLHYPLLLVALFAYGYTAVRVNAATPKPTHGIGTAVIWTKLKTIKPNKLAPPEICNMENRMTIFVDEDGILWACECEVLSKGFICRWQVIGGVDPIERRATKKHHPVRHALPAVVA